MKYIVIKCIIFIWPILEPGSEFWNNLFINWFLCQTQGSKSPLWNRKQWCRSILWWKYVEAKDAKWRQQFREPEHKMIMQDSKWNTILTGIPQIQNYTWVHSPQIRSNKILIDSDLNLTYIQGTFLFYYYWNCSSCICFHFKNLKKDKGLT